MNLTDTQIASIQQPGNVLLLAGAGSGKTSTLVERCLYHLLHPDHPVDIDEMLIVTFTEAAAAEIRERLRGRLESARSSVSAALATRLERQLALVESAHVSTLHGFCLHLVRQYFHELALDPSSIVFREDQTALFMEQALDAIFERHFDSESAESERVHALVEVYGAGNEDGIRALILKIHKYAQTLENPKKWLDAQMRHTREPEARTWQLWLLEVFPEWCESWRACLEPECGHPYASTFCKILEGGRQARTREELASVLERIMAADDQGDAWPAKTKTTYRKRIEKFFSEAAFLHSIAGPVAPLSGLSNTTDPLLKDWSWVRIHMETLLLLVQEFAAVYANLKRDHAALDFHDLEQFALDLLVGPGRTGPTPIALQSRRQFQLVFVDEYQDINAAQDAILRALSRDTAEANRFMVGDIKQSIYRFRLADPSIFQKYHTAWQADPELGRVISLTENFRSAAPILDFVNSLFAVTMRREIGGVAYTPGDHLRPGQTGRRHPSKPCVELHVRLTDKSNGLPPEEEEENVTEAELEARLVARQLRKLHDAQHPVWDPATKQTRAARWSDMVVLLRSPAPKAAIYLKEFANAGVPVQAERGSLFDNSEVTDLLSMLQILDNPLQDVPLLAVLRSPLVGLTLDELAAIRANHRAGLFWAALRHWHDLNRDKTTAREAWEKVDVFFDRFGRWRKMARHSGLSDRLEAILNETGYVDWLLTQMRPVQRQANVRRFMALAGQFDPLQRQGLQRFLRFVEAQRKAEVNGEPETVANGDAVRLMSIHKSKGLEFPVVALAGLGTPINFRDLSETILLDERYGLCAQVKPPGRGSSYPSLAYWLSARRQRRETVGEELRLLYVALTRARDTLLLFGSISRRTAEARWTAAELTSRAIERARHWLDWLGPWASRTAMRGEEPSRAAVLAGESWCSKREGASQLFRWRFYDDTELGRQAPGEAQASPAKPDFDESNLTELARRLDFAYGSAAATRASGKLSVTALRRIDEDNESALRFHTRAFRAPAIQKVKLSAAEAGIAHHLFLQGLDLRRVATAELLGLQARELREQSALTREQVEVLDLEAVGKFWASPLGRRVLGQENCVQREIPFTARFTNADLTAAGMPASIPGDEFIVVQGSIDLAVILPEEIWIVDFKTDAVTEEEVAAASRMYAPQLRLYGSALARIYRRPVRSLWLHYFTPSVTCNIAVG